MSRPRTMPNSEPVDPKYGKYSALRPTYSWRVPREYKDDVEAIMDNLGIQSKQDFVARLFDIAFPVLLNESRAVKSKAV